MISRDTVGIVYNSQIAEAKELAITIAAHLGLGSNTLVAAVEELEAVREGDWHAGVNLLITVGGDGTILRTAHVAAPKQVAILGINMGRLGFLTELRVDEALEKLDKYLDGSGWIEERAMIQATVRRSDTREDTRTYQALNEVVMGRGEVARLSMTGITVDDEPLTTYRADAVIVATATGSTGYALSAGGPILHPQSRDILMTPVAPHLDMSWTLVLPQTSRIKMSFLSQSTGVLAIDGFIDVEVQYGDSVEVSMGAPAARFLRGNPPGYYYAELVRKLGLDPWEVPPGTH